LLFPGCDGWCGKGCVCVCLESTVYCNCWDNNTNYFPCPLSLFCIAVLFAWDVPVPVVLFVHFRVCIVCPYFIYSSIVHSSELGTGLSSCCCHYRCCGEGHHLLETLRSAIRVFRVSGTCLHSDLPNSNNRGHRDMTISSGGTLGYVPVDGLCRIGVGIGIGLLLVFVGGVGRRQYLLFPG